MRKKFTLYLNTDLETGGFNGPEHIEGLGIVQGCEHYPILQIAAQVLDDELEPLVQIDKMIQPDPVRLDNMNVDTWEFHNKTGFALKWVRARDKSLVEQAEQSICNVLKNILVAKGLLTPEQEIPSYDPRGTFEIIMLGKSVWFDRTFINYQMPVLGMILSHQLADVSSVRCMMRNVDGWPRFLSNKRSTHFAMDDCDAALEDVKVIRRLLNPVCLLHTGTEDKSSAEDRLNLLDESGPVTLESIRESLTPAPQESPQEQMDRKILSVASHRVITNTYLKGDMVVRDHNDILWIYVATDRVVPCMYVDKWKPLAVYEMAELTGIETSLLYLRSANIPDYDRHHPQLHGTEINRGSLMP